MTAISFIVLELWVTKAEKSDVCKWRVFANPVTYMAEDKSRYNDINLHFYMKRTLASHSLSGYFK